MKSGFISVLCVMISFSLWTVSPAGGDTDVSCVFMERCILPCSFRPGDHPIIHWILLTSKDIFTHSYYSNQDQLGNQDQRFKNRTSLFKDQISRGNASLQLTEVEVQDQGRYKCHTSTTRGNKDSYVNLKVDAPVDKVDIQQVENRIICSSEGIYPEPGLTWSTSPPSNMDLQRTTTIHQTEQQLYNINSSLILSDSDSLVGYNCTVRTRRNWRSKALMQQPSINISSSETTIQCTTSVMNLTDFSLMWRFNHSQIILKQTGSDGSYTVSEEWRQQVKGVSESGSLTLQDLSSHHEGIYTCELSNAEETLITNTFLRMETRGGDLIIIGVIVAVVMAVVVITLCFIKKGADFRRICRQLSQKDAAPPADDTDNRRRVEDPQSLTAHGEEPASHKLFHVHGVSPDTQRELEEVTD